jgi:SAM-dependent methyltransferase
VFAYDEVPYDTKPNADTHPSAMGVVARLFGLAAPAPSRARVLELGCGNGENLIAAATYLPDARFVGLDLAEQAVLHGREAARASGAENVELLHRDVRDVRREPLGTFDFVIAHGLYSWVPEEVRPDVLGVLRDALAPSGVGFLSVNALPGWELSRALRELARHATRGERDPREKVARTLALAEALEREGAAGGFPGVLGAHARIWRAHVLSAKPPEAPFSRYAFHDLLAEYNEPFSTEALDARLAAAGLRRVAETPLDPARADGRPYDLAAAMAEGGVPFLQVLVCRAEADVAPAPLASAALDLLVSDGERFVTARELTAREMPGASDEAIGERVLEAIASRRLLPFLEPPRLARTAGDRPRVAPHVRARASAAIARGQSAATLTSALHASYEVPRAELLVVRELDGETSRSEVCARVASEAKDWPEARVARHVDDVVARLTRHGFVVAP